MSINKTHTPPKIRTLSKVYAEIKALDNNKSLVYEH